MSGRRVLVCGGTGVLGTYLVPLLVGRGNDVTVLVRSAERAALVQSWGARAAMGDILDPASLYAAAKGCEVVVHAATRIPRTFPGKPADFEANDRIREDGTRNLTEAAGRAGCARLVIQSIIWVHGNTRGEWIDEDAPLRPGRLAVSAVAMEAESRQAASRFGWALDVLRCGGFYAAESYHTREIVNRLRRRMAPIIGKGDNFQCFVHVADAALAFAQAVEATDSGGTCLVVDDEPVPLGEYLTWLAGACGAPPPLHVPEFLARMTLGGDMAGAYTASLRCRNTRARERLNWQPAYPTFRDGYAEVLPKLKAQAGG
jgi:nucleoside-diphosphate-sugar epimerase